MLSGHLCHPQTPECPTHALEIPLSLGPGLALLRSEGCQWGHIAAMVQQHVSKLYQAIGPGTLVLGLLRSMLKVCAEGLQQAGGGRGHWLG